MKYSSIITTGLMVILTTFGACTKNALEEEPFSFISSETLYSTDGGAQAALTGCYSVLADYGGFGAGYPTLTMIASGGFYTSQAAASDLNALTFGASTLWLTNNSPWDQFYNAIKVANDIITNLPKGSASEKTKQAVMGEAYFLRGMLYFNLVRMFGGVPKRIAPVTINDIDIARSSADEIYQLVIEDLEKAKTMMPEPAAQLKGRPHKFAANSLLGKVYLTQAGNDPTSPYWQKAKDELLVVYNSNAYELQKSFALVFDINNENNKESIVEIQYAISGGPNGQWTNFHTPTGSTLTPLATNGPFGRNRVNKEIFDAHRARYATDPRIDVSYVYNQYTRNTGGTQSVYPANTGNQGFPYIKKFVDPAYVSTNSNRNFMYLRYADVLLMLAECENEISGPDQAYQYVNKVLTRARDAKGDGTTIATTPANWSGMTKDEFRNRIMLERRYELIGECHLWFDVRRRGKEIFLQFLRDHNSYPKLNLSFDKIYPVNERLMLFPIPDKEISANALINPQDQNPGY